MDNRRKRQKFKPWFHYRSPTPIASPSTNPVDLARGLHKWSAEFAKLKECTNDEAISIDMGHDILLINRLTGAFGNHLERERTSQLLLAERKRMQNSTAMVPLRTSVASSVAISEAIASPVDSHDLAEHLSLISSDNAEMDGMFAAALGRGDSLSCQVLESDAMLGELLSAQDAANPDLTYDSDFGFSAMCRHLTIAKLLLKYPKISMLRNKSLVGRREKRCVDIGLPLKNENNEAALSADICTVPLDSLVLTIGSFSTQRTFSKMQEFQVLGSSTLAEFRRTLYCCADSWTDERKNRKSSGYFYIGGVFYDDMSGDNSISYSKPIVDWSKMIAMSSNGSDLHPPSRRDMKDVRWIDIPLLQSYMPYIYCHQGDCQHILMITSMAAYDSTLHPSTLEQFPHRIFQCLSRRPLCRYCNDYPVTDITLDDDVGGLYPGLFCKRCYETMHGGEDDRPRKFRKYQASSDIPRAI
eukprot:Partr_v1_DN26860_c1_g1_i2_m40305 putative small nuclear RNA activating complex, polypeptide 3